MMSDNGELIIDDEPNEKEAGEIIPQHGEPEEHEQPAPIEEPEHGEPAPDSSGEELMAIIDAMLGISPNESESGGSVSMQSAGLGMGTPKGDLPITKEPLPDLNTQRLNAANHLRKAVELLVHTADFSEAQLHSISDFYRAERMQ